MKFLGITVPKTIEKLCQPALLYLILNGIGLVIYFFMMLKVNSKVNGLQTYTMMGFILNLIIIICVVYILDKLCNYKLGKNVAWFIALFPFIVMTLMFVSMMCSLFYIESTSNQMNSIQLKVNKQEEEINNFNKKYKGNIQNGIGINTRVVEESALESKVTGSYEGYNL
tara:strand:- start:325 stop:831 length:507 start_codon:yes stop_codon:yes gene_type:complete